MQAFHSGVDTTDLLENATKLPMFLSLVVNYACTPFAELAVSYEIEEKWTLKKWMKGKFNEIQQTKVGNIVVPCEIFHGADAYLLDQVKAVRERSKSVTTTYDWRRDNKDSEQKKIGFDFPKKDEDTMAGTKVYSLVMSHIAELILLGTDDKITVGFKALSQVDDWVGMTQQTTYTKAFKEYFQMYWFDNYFFNTVYTKEEVIKCIQTFCGFQSQIWLAREIKKFSDELKEEISVLR